MRKNEKITALYERLSRDDFGKDANRGSAMKGLPRIHIHDGNPNSKTNWKQTDRNSSTISAPTVWNKSFLKKTTVGRKERCSCAAYG